MTGLDELCDQGRCLRGAPLAQYTTYRTGGAARYYAEPADRADLIDMVAGARSDGVAVLTIGRGSNLLVSDRGFDGLAIRPVGSFTDIRIDEDGAVTAGAAVPLPRLARYTVEAGRGGLEWCVGIPGSVGGAVFMNAGGHGSDTAEWLVTASILDPETGTVEARSPQQLDLSYRHSNLTAANIVLDATFRTTAQDPEAGSALVREITQWRRIHQPGGTRNAGSVFKNPPGDSAGRIIDELGLKGHHRGGASVSERHANFIVADPGTTAQDVFDLIADVRSRVKEATGIELDPEIRMVGEFNNTNVGRLA